MDLKDNLVKFMLLWGFPGGSVVKNPPAQAGDTGDEGLIPLEDPLEKEMTRPTPVFLPGKSHGQRSLAVCEVAKSWIRLSN